MSEHLSDREIGGALSDSAEPRLADHLHACAECRERAAVLLSFRERVGGLQAQLGVEDGPDHLTFEEIAAAAEAGAASEEVAAHLAECALCRRELDDLREFARDYGTVPRARGGGWSRRALVTAAAAALVALGAAVTWQRSQPSPPPTPSPEPRVRMPSFPVAAATPPPPATSGSPSRRVEEAQVLLVDARGLLRRERDGSLSGVPPRHQAAVTAVLDGSRLQIAAIVRELRPGRETLRGTGSDRAPIELEAPFAVAIETATPRFSWRGPDDAQYQLEVFDEDLRQVVGVQVRGLSWTATQPLQRGRTYGWQLRVGDAIHPQAPEPPARFHVLDEAAAAEIASARTSGSHLAAAVVLARHGLVAEAEGHLRELAALNPGAALPRRLLGELRAAT